MRSRSVIGLVSVGVLFGACAALHHGNPVVGVAAVHRQRGAPSAENLRRGLVTGTVVGPNGPVAGVHLVATRELPSSLSKRHCPTDGLKPLFDSNCADIPKIIGEALAANIGGVKTLAETTSDSNGAFSLSVAGAPDLAIWAESPEFGGVTAQVETGAADVLVAVSDGASPSGRVKDEAGRPLATVRVTAIREDHSRLFSTTSHLDGSFSFSHLPTGHYVLFASTGERAPAFQWLRATPVDLVLGAFRTATVRVTYDDAPVSGATLRFSDHHPSVSTGADGAATVAQVFAGERLDGFATTGALIGRLRCEVPDGLSPTCAVALGPSVAIDVTCTDEADAPVNGAELRAEAYEGGHWMATTDSIGRASLKALSPEKYNLEVHAPGFVPTSVEVAQPAFGEPAQVRVALHSGASILGVVIDSAGAPIAGAHLRATPLEGADADSRCDGAPCGITNALSARDGSFALRDLYRRPNEVRVEAAGFLQRTLTLAPALTPLRLTLARGGSVQGQVRDSQNRPVERAWVALLPTDQSGHAGPYGETGALGFFEINGLASGAYRLQASTGIVANRGDTGPFTNEKKEVPVNIPQRGTVLADITFDPSYEIRGRVVDDNDAPLADVMVLAGLTKVAVGESLGGGATSGPDGSFIIGGLRKGEHFIVAEKRNWMTDERPIKVSAPATDVIVRMHADGEIKGRVVDAAHHSITTFTLNDEPVRSATGAFSATVGRSGSFTLRFSADGFSSEALEVAGQMGKDIDVGEVVLEPGRTLSGQVRDAATGRPVSGVTVNTPYLPGRDFALCKDQGGVTTDSSGHYVIPHVRAGPRRLCLTQEHYVPRFMSVPDTGPLDVVLDKGASVSGSLRSATGTGLIGEDIIVREEDGLGIERFSKTDNAGGYDLGGLEPGTYIVEPNTSLHNVGLAARRITVTARSQTVLDFQVRNHGATLRFTLKDDSKALPRVHLMPGVIPMIPGENRFYERTATALPSEAVDGGIVYRFLEPGAYTAWLGPRAGPLHEQRIIVTGAGEHDIVIDPDR